MASSLSVWQNQDTYTHVEVTTGEQFSSQDEESDETCDLSRQHAESFRKGVSLRQALSMAILSAVISACVTSAIQHSLFSRPEVEAPHSLTELSETVVQDEVLPAEALFAELSVSEISAVARFAASELGCTTTYVSLSKCFLTGAEAVSLKLPKKIEALAHLDNGGAPPKRMAQVMVAHGDKHVSEGMRIYDVGPLDGRGGLASNASIHKVKSLHWNFRPLQMDDSSMDLAVTKALEPIRGMLLSTFGPVFPNLKDSYNASLGTATYWVGANVFSSLERRSSRFWFNWFKDPDEFQLSWLHTLPFNFDMAHEGPPEQWKAVNISFCGQLYHTIEALIAAEAKGKVWHCDGKQSTQYAWDVPGPSGSGKFPLPKSSKDSIQRRWTISPGGSIGWSDWKLLATIRPSSGLALHDVRYRGQRILYELSLSDCHAYYAGPSPEKQYHFSDKAYSMTQISGDMVEGLDCPAGASFIKGAIWMPFFRNGTSRADPAEARSFKLACVFESNGFQGSSWRHTQLINRHASGRPKKVLVVRAIGTVGNYDYITEVFFGEDGAVSVREAFAGYPEVDRHYVAVQPDWGSTVRAEGKEKGKLVQNLHSHYCVFKVDLDVLGVNNEFHKSGITHAVSKSLATFGQKIQESHRIDKEDPDTDLVAAATTPGLWRVVNPSEQNKLNGYPRGYAIVIGTAPSVHTYDSSHPFSASGTFARRHLAVSQRKDEEPTATSVMDFYSVTEPLLSIDNFLSDRESLVGEDLVCWVSIGKEHAARAEDQPLISNFALDFSILPWNYHEENPEMQLAMMGKHPKELVHP